jgi:hypothetical protein
MSHLWNMIFLDDDEYVPPVVDPDPVDPDPVDPDPVDPDPVDPDPVDPDPVDPDPVDPTKRGFLVVDPNFTRAKLASDAARTDYDNLWKHVNTRHKMYIEPASRGGKYQSTNSGFVVRNGAWVFEEFPEDGVLDVYYLRNVYFPISNVLLLLEQTGDPDAFDWLVDVGQMLIQNNRSMLRPGGVRQFRDWKKGNHDRLIDQDLIMGWFCEMLYAFEKNPSRIGSVKLTAFRNFVLNHLVKGRLWQTVNLKGSPHEKAKWTSAGLNSKTLQQCFAALAEVPETQRSGYNSTDSQRRAPLSLAKHGHSVLHSITSVCAAYYFLDKLYGWSEFKTAHELLSRGILTNAYYVQTTKGLMLQTSQQPSGMLSYRTKVKSQWWDEDATQGSQDSTYARENVPHIELMARHGYSAFTADNYKYIKAYARTVIWCCMNLGPQGSKFAGCISGSYYTSDHGGKKGVVIRNKDFVPGSLKVSPGDSDGGDIPISGFVRGPMALGAYRIKNETALWNDLVAINKRYQRGDHQNAGHNIALLLASQPRRNF